MNMNKKSEEEHFAILRKIGNKSELSQREMAKELGIQFGKTKLLLKRIAEKRLN